MPLDRPQLNLIVAMDEQGGIGLNNSLPWNYPQDLRRFRQLTLNHTVVMGRRTWLSLPNRYLSGRRNIVITRNPRELFETYYENDLLHQNYPVEFYDNPLNPIIWKSEFQVSDQVWYIGGALIYQSVIEVVDRIELTQIPGRYNCDTFFPTIPSDFEIIQKTQEAPLNYVCLQRRTADSSRQPLPGSGMPSS